LGTVRFLGTFLSDPLDVPAEVVAYQAGQLSIEDVSCLRAYAEREMTPLEHAWEIRREYGYREFAEAEAELRSFVSARCATSAEGPKALFDRATAWLVEHKVLLPGVTTLARLVASLQAEASEQLSLQIVGGVDVGLRGRLNGLLEVPAGSRFSDLERFRKSPAKITGLELERALTRVGDVRRLGAGGVDLSALPENRVLALARYGMSSKAPLLRELAEPRRTATVVATIRHLEQKAIDDALDLFVVLMQTRLLARAERESAKEQLRTLRRFAAASAKLAAAIQILLNASTEDVSTAEVWKEIERVVPRGQVAAALDAVRELAPPPDEEADEAWRAELLKRHQTIRPFLPVLIEVIEFGAVEGGDLVVEALRRLPELLTRKKVSRDEITTGLVTGAWRRLVYANPNGDQDVVDHRAYTFCVLEHLHRGLNRRDVFAMGSDRWGDPRTRLLSGEAWAQAKGDVITALQLTEQPDQHLAEFTGRLDAAYRAIAARLPDNAALELIRDGERISLVRLDAEPEPPSLVELRRLVGGMLPRVDITDALLEVRGWTGCFDEYTHISEARARMEDLPISVAAVLVTEACNIGFRPVVKPSVPALTRDRLSHVDQNYVRAENHARGNGRLIDFQAGIEFAQALGGGLVASVDGLRFVVPVATINAGPNPHYFGMRRGATWLNAVNDQYAGIGAIVVPGTVRDSLYVLDLLLNIDGGPRPEVVVTDQASYTDMVFGLFRILGYQFSPRIADLADTRFWRVDAAADYGLLNSLARSKVSLNRIRESWPDMLRVAGSLHMGTVCAYDLLRMLSRDGKPGRLGQAFEHYGRIAKTLHLLSVIDDEDYRRRISAQIKHR
jgi:TnpA family transposase